MIEIPINIPPVLLLICETTECRDKVKEKFGLEDKDFSEVSGTIEYFHTNEFYEKHKTTICALITLDLCKCKNRDLFKIKLSTLMHEIQHFIDKIEKEFGIKDTEYKAYLVEYLLSEILDKIMYPEYKIIKHT